MQFINLKFFTDFICHKRPERSFKIRGWVFPVCSRCTGVYIGAILYYIYAYFFYVAYTFEIICLAIILCIPALVDGFTQFIGLRVSINGVRVLTGFLLGMGLGIIFKVLKYRI